MSFCCPIHGNYAPTPGVTLAICPACSSSRPVAVTDEARIRADQTERILTWLRGRTGYLGGGFTCADDIADALADRLGGIDKGERNDG